MKACYRVQCFSFPFLKEGAPPLSNSTKQWQPFLRKVYKVKLSDKLQTLKSVDLYIERRKLNILPLISQICKAW